MVLRTRLFSSRNPLRPLRRCFSSTGAQRADVTHAVRLNPSQHSHPSTNEPTKVIGAGVVGLAIARQLASREGTSTILLERHDAPGTETSSRNSEVSITHHPATQSEYFLTCHPGNPCRPLLRRRLPKNPPLHTRPRETLRPLLEILNPTPKHQEMDRRSNARTVGCYAQTPRTCSLARYSDATGRV